MFGARHSQYSIKVVVVWLYFLSLPYLVFLSYLVAKRGVLEDEYERLIIILVMLLFIFLHKYMIIQFIGEECE